MRNLIALNKAISWPTAVLGAIFLGTALGMRANAAETAFPAWYQAINGDLIYITLVVIATALCPLMNVKHLATAMFVFVAFPIVAQLADKGDGVPALMSNFIAGALLTLATLLFAASMFYVFAHRRTDTNTG